MINYIWAIFILVGIIYGIISGNSEMINNTLINSGSNAIEIILKLIPLLCLWQGIMKIAEDSGLINILSKHLSKYIKVLFPELPSNSDAITYISTNIILNMLGVGNAATPFGLKAMKSMQELNKKKDTASRSMITFLVINTSSVTIIPTTIISFRVLHNSVNPTSVVPLCIITTILSSLIGIILDRLFYLLTRRKYEVNS